MQIPHIIYISRCILVYLRLNIFKYSNSIQCKGLKLYQLLTIFLYKLTIIK